MGMTGGGGGTLARVGVSGREGSGGIFCMGREGMSKDDSGGFGTGFLTAALLGAATGTLLDLVAAFAAGAAFGTGFLAAALLGALTGALAFVAGFVGFAAVLLACAGFDVADLVVFFAAIKGIFRARHSPRFTYDGQWG